MKRTCLLIVMLVWPLLGLMQTGAIRFMPLLNGQALTPGKPVWVNTLKDTIRITSCRFYISDIQLFRNGKVVQAFPSKYLLADTEDTSSFTMKMKDRIRIDTIRFVLGVDSVIQTSGAFGGDLDPSKGMYWAWQSGYIHFKLEGEAPSCTTRNHRFQWHLGGYRSPWNTIRVITLPVKEDATVYLELLRLLEILFHQQVYELMSPGLKAREASGILATSFYTK